MPDSYVWLEYYAAAPVSKNVKSDEYKYSDKHNHNARPTQKQLNDLQPSLTDNVTAVYGKYNSSHPTAQVVVPTEQAIITARTFDTRSAR